ncbi:hypothetical protein EVAR_56814_1 [Eumeta japonica]|uniref:Uncharacterized protein n=1 Tax=Eumeta variegata TaxID=151549 RepID=A0A4C1Y182_EUMVA|nr:hypothetical protein EVAR_56814_1 [Eumeta japonica]
MYHHWPKRYCSGSPSRLDCSTLDCHGARRRARRWQWTAQGWRGGGGGVINPPRGRHKSKSALTFKLARAPAVYTPSDPSCDRFPLCGAGGSLLSFECSRIRELLLTDQSRRLLSPVYNYYRDLELHSFIRRFLNVMSLLCIKLLYV